MLCAKSSFSSKKVQNNLALFDDLQPNNKNSFKKRALCKLVDGLGSGVGRRGMWQDEAQDENSYILDKPQCANLVQRYVQQHYYELASLQALLQLTYTTKGKGYTLIYKYSFAPSHLINDLRENIFIHISAFDPVKPLIKSCNQYLRFSV